MRICPKCGYREHPIWRPRRSRVFCDYAKTEDIKYILPELYTNIEKAHPEFYFDGHFIYHITKTGLNIEKIEKELFDLMKWGSEPQEKTNHSPFLQTKLKKEASPC